MVTPQLTMASRHRDDRVLEGGGKDDWKSKPELPTAEEILQTQELCEALPYNLVDRPWASKEAYLAAHYKILRCEGVEGLRFSTNTFKRNPGMSDNKNTCVYTEVHVKGYLMTRAGPACRIEFSTRHAGRKIKWQQSRRLTPGTAVAITTAGDNFKSVCRIATIAQRPFTGGLDQSPPEIDIFWANPEDAVLDPGVEMIMVESRQGYFESVRHPLVGLQQAADSSSPIDKYLVECDKSDTAPLYIRDSPTVDISSVVHHLPETVDRTNPQFNEMAEMLKAKEPLKSYNILGDLPNVSEMSTLDDSQLEALHRIVSKELAIVQGPPGTGKTFTSVSAVKVLLANRRRGDPPIVVAAQTNHALDQLLLHCHEAGAKIMRIGGRTEDELIATRTVYSLRRMAGKIYDKTFRSLETCRLININQILELVEGIFSDKLMHPETLLAAEVISQEQHDSLMDGEWEGAVSDDALDYMCTWLGDQLVAAAYIRQKWPDFAEEETEDEIINEYEMDTDLDQILGGDEDKGRMHGTLVPIAHKWTGRSLSTPRWRSQAERYLAECSDMWDIPPSIRGGVYRVLQSRLLAARSQSFCELMRCAVEHCKDLKLHKWSKDIQMVSDQEIDIVGCTTTGLTKYREFIAGMSPRTLLIEEAAETREANIASALYQSVQQLILVGDHQQLTPHCDIRILGDNPYNLNVSMFERLVGLGLPYTMLNQQRRMKPELRYILSYFYPALTDHPSVLFEANRPSVPGMGGRNCWLFDHEWPEESDHDNSKFNLQEAQMISKFVAYLMQNGVKSSQITILTFYNGQRKMILKALKREPSIGNVANQFYNVFTVDSYQGEENDIVLLSLVRSPKLQRDYAVGFLEDKNRAVVAISRARRGFYVFGNVTNLLSAHAGSFQLWGRVFNGFADQGRVRRDRGIPIVCQRHGNQCWFKDPEAFVGNAGGCWIKCKEKLPCGHDCKLNCHASRHASLPCLEPCSRVLNCGHRCENLCTDKCFCRCNRYKPPVQSQYQLATSSPSAGKVLGQAQIREPRHGNRFTGGPRGQKYVPKGDAEHNSPSPRPGTAVGSALSGHLHSKPATITSDATAPVRGNGNVVADWKEFVLNVEQHDEQMRKYRLAVAEETSEQQPLGVESDAGTPSPDKAKPEPVIKEKFAMTDLVRGSHDPASEDLTFRSVGRFVDSKESREGDVFMDTTMTTKISRSYHSMRAAHVDSDGLRPQAPIFEPQRRTHIPSYGRSQPVDSEGGYGFDAEVLGVQALGQLKVERMPSRSASSTPAGKPAKDQTEDEDDWLIEL